MDVDLGGIERIVLMFENSTIRVFELSDVDNSIDKTHFFFGDTTQSGVKMGQYLLTGNSWLEVDEQHPTFRGQSRIL